MKKAQKNWFFILSLLILFIIPFTSALVSQNVTTEAPFTHITLNNNLTKYYETFDRNATSTLYDYSNFDNDGTLENVTFSSVGYIGGDYLFNGVNSTILVPYTQSLNLSRPFSVSLWFNATALVSGNTLIAEYNGSKNNWRIFQNTNTKVRFEIFNSAGTSKVVTSTTSFVVGNWYHIVAVANETRLILYVNGVQEDFLADSTGMTNTNVPLTIGSDSSIATPSDQWSGHIDQVAIFNYSLNSTDVTQLYNIIYPVNYPIGIQAVNNFNLTDNPKYFSFNISTNCQTFNGTSLGFKAGYGGAGDYTYANQINFTNCNISNYQINSTMNNLSLIFYYFSNSYNSYSPILLNYTLVTNGDLLPPNATLISPQNNLYTNLTSQNFTINVSDNVQVKNITLNIYNSTGIVTQTTTTVNSQSGIFGTIFNFLFDGVFNWFYTVTDTLNNIFQTGNKTITIDTTYPQLHFISPLNQSYGYQITNVTFDVNETNLDYCQFNNGSLTVNISCSSVYSTNSHEGSNSWMLFAYDLIGQSFNRTITFSIDTTSPTWSGINKNESSVLYNSNVKFNTTWFDAQGLNNYIFAINQGNGFFNFSGLISGTTDTSIASSLINANASTLIQWYFGAYDNLGNYNQTPIQSFTVQNRTSTLVIGTDKDVYEQSYGNSSLPQFFTNIEARYTDTLTNQPISDGTCILSNDEEAGFNFLNYNSTTGNYSASVSTANLYGTVNLTVDCMDTNYLSQNQNKSIKVFFYMFIWEAENRTFDSALNTSTYMLRTIPDTPFQRSFLFNASVGDNLLYEFNYFGVGINGSFQRQYDLDGDFIMNLNASFNTSTCEPHLCYFIKDERFNKIYEDCHTNNTLITPNVFTLLNQTIPDEHTLVQNTFFGMSLRTNCTNPQTINVSFIENSSIPAITLTSAQPFVLGYSIVGAGQLDNNYTIYANTGVNTNRFAILNLSNPTSVATTQQITFIPRVNFIYPNSIIANTSYVFNSSGSITGSDNSSVNPQFIIKVESNNQVTGFSQLIQPNSSVLQLIQGNFRDGIRDTEELNYDLGVAKSYNISIFTIFTSVLSIKNVSVISNYSTYGISIPNQLLIYFTNTTSTYDITNQTVIDTNNTLLKFPKIDSFISQVSYQVFANRELTPPNATIINPMNNTFTNSPNMNFTLNITDNVGLSNATLFLYNQSGLYLNQTSNINGTQITFIDNIFGLADGVYTWFYNIVDLANNIFQTTLYLFHLSTVQPTIVINSPSGIYQTNNLLINITSSANSSVYFNNQTGLEYYNSTVTRFFPDGYYNFTAIVNDTYGNIVSKGNIIYVDTQIPKLSFVSPSDLNGNTYIRPFIETNVSVNDTFFQNVTTYLYNNSLYELSEFTGNISPQYVRFINLSNGNYLIKATACDITNICNSTETRSIKIDQSASGLLALQLIISQYPYLDNGTVYLIQAKVTAPLVVPNANVTIRIKELDNSFTSIQMYFNSTLNTYTTALMFNLVGDYPFTLSANSTDFGYKQETGTFLVRNKYDLFIKLFNQADLSAIVNDACFVTAEFSNPKKINPVIEPFIQPVTFNFQRNKVFNAPYISGQAQLVLYEPNTDYTFRWFCGQAQFSGEYGQFNITKSYGESVYLSTEKLNGTSSTYQYVLNAKELKPWAWATNWILIILVIGGIIVGIFMFFVMPDKPWISLIFIVLIVGGSTLIRFIIWWLFSW